MIPYEGLFFFYLMGLGLLPAVVLGLMGKPLKDYGLLFTVFLLVIVFAANGQLATLVFFYLWQIAISTLFLHCKRRTRPLLWLAVTLALLPLAVVKLGEVLPAFGLFSMLGISYISFRSVQILLDVYDGVIAALSLSELTYFLLFFPTVASGPLDRYRRFAGDLHRNLSREEYRELLGRGIWKLLFGAFSGIVFGGLIQNLWLAPLPAQGMSATVSYMYGYTLFLFFNFAGYSSMAIGTAYLLGITLPENFNQPFLSMDMKDLWARWHISLSTWLRDYVYTRFVRRALKEKRFKNPRTASYLGYLLTMGTMGVWHGLSPRFLLYGLYHGLLMCLNEALDLNWKGFRRLKQHPWGQVLCAVVTFHLFSFGLLLFSGRLR